MSRGGKRSGAGRPKIYLSNPLGVRIDNDSLNLLQLAKEQYGHSYSHLVNYAIKRYINRLYHDIVELNDPNSF